MGVIDKIKAAVTGQEQQETNLITQLDEAVTLTWKQRLIGFGTCFGVGVALSIISIPMLWTLNITAFAVLYSIGSIMSIGSTMFLMGPVKQCQKMFEAHRALATAIYIAAIVGTLVLAFTTGNAGLVLLMLVIQVAALAWYCITWIPGGTTAIKALLCGS